MKTLLILIASITVVAGSPLGRSSYIDAIERCNTYVDKLLVNAAKDNNLESFPVYGRELNFRKKVVFYPFKCYANLTEGHITGLGNLHRKGACSISFHNRRLKIHTEIETKQINFNFTGKASVIGSTADVMVDAVTSPLKIEMDFSFNGSSGDDGKLDSYRPTVISNMNVWIDGLGMLEWIREPMEENVEELFFNLINTLTHHHLKEAFREDIQKNPFSIEDLEDVYASTIEPVTEDHGTTPRGKEEYTIEDSNSYIDSVLANRFLFESKYSKLDPLVLSSTRLEKVFVRDPQNEDANFLKLEKGELEHLSNVRRNSECSIPEFIERNITFECSLGFDELTLKYQAEAHNGSDVYNFQLIVTVKQTKLSLKVTSTLSDNVPTILDYSVDNVGKISIIAAIDIVGAQARSPSSIETLYNSKVILTYFSEEVNSILKGRFKEVLNYSIYKTPLHFLDS
ncbi:uncharacterized protein [Parasteatoda tepidariorum]|uniref:uncharacterized protein n=1 Tax=Parasteatoda tepidariorum TaxID=114398 RepID=UPI001C7230E0|nr:uncharacterized protein LOC122270795 [Parasteatoda tepidariorum]XP_042905500.1 uncharacterized protein LOC122270795 [Parasteatoda tepidariorum]